MSKATPQFDRPSDAATSHAIIHSRPRWLVRETDPEHAQPLTNRLRRWARGVAIAPDDARILVHLERVAGILQRPPGAESVAVGITSTGRSNRQGMTAVGLATLWARWQESTLLIDVSGATTRFGRSQKSSTPSIADVVDAIEFHRDLPAPSRLTSVLDDLEVLAGLGDWSLSRLAEAGMLRRLNAALRERYSHIVWCLPPIGGPWSPRVMGEVLDEIVVSACRGQADRRMIEQLAREVAELNLPPVQLVWHH